MKDFRVTYDSHHFINRIVGLSGILFCLTGCQSPADLFGRSYCAPAHLTHHENTSGLPPKVYCYRTLGTTECYSQPFERGQNRLVGYNDAPQPSQSVQSSLEDDWP